MARRASWSSTGRLSTQRIADSTWRTPRRSASTGDGLAGITPRPPPKATKAVPKRARVTRASGSVIASSAPATVTDVEVAASLLRRGITPAAKAPRSDDTRKPGIAVGDSVIRAWVWEVASNQAVSVAPVVSWTLASASAHLACSGARAGSAHVRPMGVFCQWAISSLPSATRRSARGAGSAASSRVEETATAHRVREMKRMVSKTTKPPIATPVSSPHAPAADPPACHGARGPRHTDR